MFLSSLIDELCTKEVRKKTGWSFDYFDQWISNIKHIMHHVEYCFGGIRLTQQMFCKLFPAPPPTISYNNWSLFVIQVWLLATLSVILQSNQ